MTFYYKRIFPTIWFGFLLLFVAAGLIAGLASGRFPPPPFLIMPVLMAVLGYFLMKKLVFDLVDEVFDDGDALIVKNGNREERIALADIINVGYSVFVNPLRVTLRLRRAGMFGGDVSFCAPVRWLPFATSPIIDELIHRIDAKRAV